MSYHVELIFVGSGAVGCYFGFFATAHLFGLFVSDVQNTILKIVFYFENTK